MLYYDDFLKYTKSPKKAGGLYLVILELEGYLLSHPLNLFTLNLVSSIEEYNVVINKITDELIELNEVHLARLPNENQVKVECYLALFAADTPQRYNSSSI